MGRTKIVVEESDGVRIVLVRHDEPWVDDIYDVEVLEDVPGTGERRWMYMLSASQSRDGGCPESIREWVRERKQRQETCRWVADIVERVIAERPQIASDSLARRVLEASLGAMTLGELIEIVDLEFALGLERVVAEARRRQIRARPG